jgi:hypothetical protein
VEFAVDLDEGHGSLVAGEDGERPGTQVFAVEWVGVGGDGWDGWRPAPVGDAVAVDDVFGIDAWPHDDVHRGESGAYVGELGGERPLCGVEGGGLVQEFGAFGVEGGEFLRPVRQFPVAGGIADCRHTSSQRSSSFGRSSFGRPDRK